VNVHQTRKTEPENFFETIASQKFTLCSEDGGIRWLRNIGNFTHYCKLHAEDGGSGLLWNITTCDITRRHIRHNSLNFHCVEHMKFCIQKIILRFYTRTVKNTIIDKTLTYASETSTLSKRDRKQLNIFERKVYRRILGPVYDNGKENWKIWTNKEIYAIL
jgi:hypothetical protein